MTPLVLDLARDTVDGGAGTDTLSVFYSSATSGISATLNVSTGNGKITTGSSSVTFSSIEQINISGTGYNDSLTGGNGNDTLSGSSGNNTLIGGAGNDFLSGGSDIDTLTGGNGTDSFSFEHFYQGVDTITDFTVSQGDLIVVTAYGFDGGLTYEAALSPTQFVLGTAAQDADDRFIYNKATGALWFDSDGTGSIASVQFATLSSKPTLTSSSIFVVNY